MTKRIIAIVFALVLIFSVALIPASAADSYRYMVDDSAGVMSSDEVAKLNVTVQEVSEKCQCNLAVVTVSDLSVTPANSQPFTHTNTTADYADQYYDANFGKNTDGVVVLLVLSNQSGKRDWYFSTAGKCIKRLSDSEREDILDDMQNNHNPNTKGYYDTLNAAVLGLKEAIPPHVSFGKTLIAIVIGFVISLIIMMILKGKLKTVRAERGAVNYVRPGSMNVTASRDTYLYSTVSRTAKPKNNSSSHTSSGGGSHGGGGRSF